MAPLQKIASSEEEIDPRGEKRTRSKRKKKEKEAEVPDWEVSSGTWRSQNNRSKRIARGLGIWIGSLGAVMAVVVFFVKAGEPEDSLEKPDYIQAQDQFDDLVKSPLILPEEESEDTVELPKVMRRSETEFLEKAEPLCREFFKASTVTELLPLIYDPERVGKKIRDYYPTGQVTPTEMDKFNPSGRVSYKDNFAAVTIQTKDFETKQLAFIDGVDGLKVDWESWVGWSELPWKEILEKKPQSPVLVRAMMKWVDYYNFGFSDEDAWRSYRLVSPDGESMLYGYAARNSLLDQRMRPSEAGATVAVTLKIHFRKDEQSTQQVVIDQFIADGWVVREAIK